MHPLRLDYKKASITWTRQGSACLVLGLALVGSVGAYYAQLAREVERATEALTSVRQMADRERKGKEKFTGELKTYRAEIKEAEAVLGRLTIPWDPLFIAVEQVGARHRDRIAFLAIHPDVGERRVLIDGRSADLDVLLDFVTQLTDSDIVSHAYLSHHQREDKDRAKPVLFSVVAEWKT